MSSIAHGMRKRLSIATTRTKTVERNMSNDYTTEKHAVQRQKATLVKALEFVKKGHTGWKDIAESYKKFAEMVLNDTPLDSPLYEKTSKANESANAVHAHMSQPPDSSVAAARLVAHVQAYIAELTTIEKEFPVVEHGFIEVSRYENKVGKLSGKASKSEKKGNTDDKTSSRVRKNIDKLEEERAKHRPKLEGVIDMMKRANAKYPKVLHCAHTAYWLYEDSFLTATESHTKETRESCNCVKEELVSLDLNASPPPVTS